MTDNTEDVSNVLRLDPDRLGRPPLSILRESSSAGAFVLLPKKILGDSDRAGSLVGSIDTCHAFDSEAFDDALQHSALLADRGMVGRGALLGCCL